MPGTRLDDTERRLRDWWLAANPFPYPVLDRVTVGGTGLRGINNMSLEFRYPLTVLCGKNGTGKTTLLSLAALGFHSPSGFVPFSAHHVHISSRYRPTTSHYTFSDFFFKGPGDTGFEGAEVTWQYAVGRQSSVRHFDIQKRYRKWMHYERRPERPVQYLGMSRTSPAVEQSVLRFAFGGPVSSSSAVQLNEQFRGHLGHIMGRTYAEADVVASSRYRVRRCISGHPYSSFNMGAGEDILIDFLYVLQESPPGTLIAIEEIETGLHPEALNRLAKHLQEVMLEKKLQVVATTHSSFFLDSIPQEARVLVQREGPTTALTYQPTTRFATSVLSGRAVPELCVYCEDDFAERLVRESLDVELNPRTDVIPVGSNSELARQADFHVRSRRGERILLIWDGDTAENSIAGWIGEQGARVANVNWSRTPGGVPPERWAVQALNCPDGWNELALEFGGSSDWARETLQALASEPDHHSISHALAQRTNLVESDATARLVRSLRHINPNPLSGLAAAVRDVLEGRHVAG